MYKIFDFPTFPQLGKLIYLQKSLNKCKFSRIYAKIAGGNLMMCEFFNTAEKRRPNMKSALSNYFNKGFKPLKKITSPNLIFPKIGPFMFPQVKAQLSVSQKNFLVTV